MQQQLSHNQKLVHKLLKSSKKPLKAYSILFEIQKTGIKSPTQVYRALDKLIEIGKVHKIESKNSYVACKNTNCLNKSSTTFLICNSCEKITEIEDEAISEQFSNICKNFNSKYSEHNLEIFGTCFSCSK
tara:strand:+ start:539 stop:928 length:390 start_codon:yes stop_codon:yes gene_type:complete